VFLPVASQAPAGVLRHARLLLVSCGTPTCSEVWQHPTSTPLNLGQLEFEAVLNGSSKLRSTVLNSGKQGSFPFGHASHLSFKHAFSFIYALFHSSALCLQGVAAVAHSMINLAAHSLAVWVYGASAAPSTLC
jgi:hypothetical protein